jgi:Mrp family chromosome partitioning ATPase/capsular polysaccharide biosynthesis protein
LDRDIDAPTLVAAVLRYRVTSLVLVAGFGLLGAVLALAATQEAAATAIVGLRDPRGVSLVRSAGATGTDLTRYTSERAAFARSEGVVQAASDLDGGISASDLRDRLSTSASTDADVIRITVRAETAKRARDLANNVARAFEQEQQRNIRIQADAALAELDASRDRVRAELDALGAGTGDNARRASAADVLTQLENRRTDVQIEAAAFGSGVEFTDPAREPSAPLVSADLIRNLLAGLIFGAFVAMFIAWLRASSLRIIDRSDVAMVKLGIPLLGEIPEYGPRTVADAKSFVNLPLLEYELVAGNISMRLSAGVLVVTGSISGDGTTTTATNVAAAAAHSGLRVALVDGDVRGYGLTRLLKRPVQQPGFLDLVSGRAALSDVAAPVLVGSGFFVTMITVGSAGPERRDLLRSERIASAFDELRAQFDLVVVDAAPVLLAPDAMALAIHGDALALVLRRGSASARVERLKHQIEVLSDRTIGFVFTHADISERADEHRRPDNARGNVLTR